MLVVVCDVSEGGQYMLRELLEAGDASRTHRQVTRRVRACGRASRGGEQDAPAGYEVRRGPLCGQGLSTGVGGVGAARASPHVRVRVRVRLQRPGAL